MKELLECKDLRVEPRVIAAFDALCPGIYLQGCNAHLEVMAFKMRDAFCIDDDAAEDFEAEVTGLQDRDYKPWSLFTADSWIIAATLCYEEMKGGDTKEDEK